MNILKKLSNLLLFFSISFQFLFVLTTAIRHGKEFTKEKDEYDFIVIGGGLAGCVVAARLSENSRFSVLLLEAGGIPPLFSKIPAMTLMMQNPKYNWNFMTKAQNNVDNRVFNLKPGKMLGGSGSLNGLVWLRANKRDFDEWQQMGVENWNWEDVLPYYKKVESDFSIRANEQFSGFKGPIIVTAPWNDVTFYSVFLDEVRKYGYKYNDGLDGNNLGYIIGRVNVYNNERQSSYTNYLIAALKRKNLSVIHFAVVEKILFNDQKEAVGVLYVKDDELFEAKATREVIVSAGALNTPKILMLSGIGLGEHLNFFGIDVISDLSVGDNYQSHTAFYKNMSKQFSKNIKKNIELFKNYSAIYAFLNTDISSNRDYPDTLFEIMGEFVDTTTNEIFYNVYMQQNRPKSRGSIRLASTDPNEAPLIDSNLLDDELDMNVSIRMAQFLANILSILENTQDTQFTVEKFDDTKCRHINTNTDDYWRCIVRNNVRQSNHYCCTAQMGSTSNPSAVVDNHLRVIGVKKLRVIDSSVMPTVTSVNIQATVFMIAERGAEFIKLNHDEFV